MSKLITTKINDKIASRIERAAEAAHMDTTSFLRHIIIKGLRAVEEEAALQVPMNYSMKQLRQDLAR